MPPIHKRPLTWKCMKCPFLIRGNDKDAMKDEGFDHQQSDHELVSENRDWFNTHIQNYYEIS